jgi:hypothetical protein
MKTRNIWLLFFFVLFPSNITHIDAQEIKDSVTLYKVETFDGNVYVGTIVSKEENLLILKTVKLGELRISFPDVKEMKEIALKNIKNGEIWPENPNSTRYFYLPNGYGLEKGEGYYQNTWVLFNQVSYGLTNSFSMGVGLMPLFLFGVNGFPVWITPKFSIPIEKDKWNLGVGAIIGGYVGRESENIPTLGMFYGVSTFGSREKNMTVGLGYAFADGDVASTPVVTLGGTIQTGRKHFLLTENYFVFSDGELVALLWMGGRYASQHIAIDYGLIIPVSPGIPNFIAMPWLGLTVPFGNKQKAYITK